jgi:DNA-binding NarL/FixJ family response regulator
MHRGWAALAAGHPGRAARWLEEALSGLERRDPAGMKGFCSSLLVTAYAVDGDVRRVREVLAGQRSAPRGVLPVFRPVAGLAHAWVADVEGRVADAGALALEAAARAAEQGQPGVEALLLHRAVHFGRAGEVADRLRDLAARLDSALVEDLAAHAQAAAAVDGGRLEEATRRLERTGTMMFAADSAAAAAAAYQRTGALRHAAEWTTKARSLAQACGLVGHPEETGLPPADITTREAEVAQLAGQGLSNRAIADRLYLSVRTVETHLSHVYTKLGIGGRADLAAFLPMTSKGGPRSGNRERQPSDADHR